MKTIYFILGMHRSGTSALGGTLNILGLDFGTNLMKADQENPKGYYENNLVYEINRTILKEAQSSWDDYNFDISTISVEKKEVYIKQIIDLINNEFKYSESIAIKDPRICMLFPIWEEALVRLDIDIKIILPYRNPIEVAQSLKIRNDFSQEKSLLIWSKHFLSAEYLSRGYERIFISFDSLVKAPVKTMNTLSKFTGFEIDEIIKSEISLFLDKNTKHNNTSIKNFSKEVPTFLYDLIQIIKSLDFTNEETLDRCRNDFYYSLNMFQHIEIENKLKDEISKRKTLESITDLSSFDENYYKNKYKDLKEYAGTVDEHYFKYGKAEGRFPNLYCEINNLDTKNVISKDEVIYQKDLNIKELTTQKDALENEYNEKVQEIEGLNKNIDQVVADLASIKESKCWAYTKPIRKLQNTFKGK